MSAITGAVAWRTTSDHQAFCAASLADMRALGPSRQATRTLGPCSFGHSLLAVLPEDDSAPQPLESRSRKLLLTADARIDNRDELARALRIPTDFSDSELILRCWERWGVEAPVRLLGDFAFAIWDGERRELSLIRSPISSRTLFWHASPEQAGFASLPQPLRRMTAATLNVPEMARGLVGGGYFGSSETLFSGIHSVDPGVIIAIRDSGTAVTRYWHPESVGTVQRKREDAAQELEWELRRAVNASLRRSGGPAASHLSGGRDSSAVTACAASLLAEGDEPLFAYTAAPRAGFQQSSTRHLFDESDLASLVARRFENVRHVISRSTKTPICGLLDRASRLHAAPMGSPANLAYWCQILARAERDGCRVLLTGGNGNFSISIGGLSALADVWQQDGFLGWWRAAKGCQNVSWKTLLNQSFGHRAPVFLHRFRRAWMLGQSAHAGDSVYSPRLQTEIRRAEREDRRSWRDSYRTRIQQIYKTIDFADNLGPGLHGIDLRNPTADRRLVEFCLSIPARDIVGSQGQRPIYDLAFKSLVPAQVRHSRLKGFQAADWFEIYDPEELRAGIRRYSENAAVREFIDLQRIEDLLDRWPAHAGDYMPTYVVYANHVLVAIALASWLNAHF